MVGVFYAGLAVGAVYITALVVPLASSGPLRDFALARNGDLREEFGWNEMVKTVADIRDSLPPDEQTNVGVLVGNYGEQGAIEILGTRLPLACANQHDEFRLASRLSNTDANNSHRARIFARSADRAFTGCRVAGHIWNSIGVKNEESEAHPDIFVCGPPRTPWPEFWKDHQRFG